MGRNADRQGTRRIKPFNGRPEYAIRVGEPCYCSYRAGDGYRDTERSAQIKEGVVKYIHPGGRYIVVEFAGQADIWNGTRHTWRETLWAEDVQRRSPQGKKRLLEPLPEAERKRAELKKIPKIED